MERRAFLSSFLVPFVPMAFEGKVQPVERKPEPCNELQAVQIWDDGKDDWEDLPEPLPLNDPKVRKADWIVVLNSQDEDEN